MDYFIQGFIACAAATIAAEKGHPTMTIQDFTNLVESMCNAEDMIPRVREVMGVIHNARTRYVNDHPMEFLDRSAHRFVSNPAISAYEIPTFLKHQRKKAQESPDHNGLGGGRVHFLRNVQVDKKIPPSQERVIERNAKTGLISRVWYNEKFFRRHECESDFVKEEVTFRGNEADAKTFVQGSDNGVKALAAWSRTTMMAAEEQGMHVPPQAGTDVLLSDMGGHYVVLMPIKIQDDSNAMRSGGAVMLLNSRRDDQAVDTVYGKVVGRAIFGTKWCDAPKEAGFRKAKITDAAFSPRGWEARSSLLDDPLGEFTSAGINMDFEDAPNGQDVDHRDGETPGVPDSPWVVTETIDWVPISPRSPRKLRLDKAKQKFKEQSDPSTADWNAAAVAHQADDFDLTELGDYPSLERQLTEDGSLSPRNLPHSVTEAVLSPKSPITAYKWDKYGSQMDDILKEGYSAHAVEELVDQAIDFADMVYVSVGAYVSPARRPLKGYAACQFPKFLEELAEGGGDWQHPGKPSIVVVLLDPNFTEDEGGHSCPGFEVEKGWRSDTTMPAKCSNWLWRMKNPQFRNLVVVVAKAGYPTPSTFMTWGIKSQSREHQRFYLGDFTKGQKLHGDLVAHAASVRFASNNGMNLFATVDAIQDKVKAFWEQLMYVEVSHPEYNPSPKSNLNLLLLEDPTRGIQLVQHLDKNQDSIITADEVIVLDRRQMGLLSSVYSRQQP